ncbi:hypothetical protein SI65_08519 [Aspergillus cristatus]|uniref:4a-hydroxytetrahydrobiopterin dehydratase n=1 Tax=Aspergillus cristatus TaxID=573508 RepID=A0A1E3B542_ASPCR|nr:hypothetical protein SI65_08519 [Aspergillus cristatus]
MQRNILQLSRLARTQTAQPVPRVFWTATRTCPLRVPIASTSVATCSPVRMASSTNQPSTIRFSEGEETEQVATGLNSLRQRGWQLDQDGMGVTKTFYFKAYLKAVSFVNVIAAESAAKKHHPTITLRFGSVDVHWTTHNPRGLSQKDVTLAEHCENGADLIGAVKQGEGQKCY